MRYQLTEPLTATEMIAAMTDFRECYGKCLRRRQESEREIVEEWVKTLTKLSPVFLLRPDSMSKMSDEIFSNEHVRAFILDLHFYFFTMHGNGKDFVAQLAQKVMEGLSPDGPLIDYSLLPEEVARSTGLYLFNENKTSWFRRTFARMFGVTEPRVSLFLFLRNNTWLLIVFILILMLDEIEQQA